MIKQFLLTVAGVFSGLVLFFVGVPLLIFALVAGSASPSPTPGRAVLVLDLRRSLTDQQAQSPLASFGSPSLSVLSTVQTLQRAEQDPRVRGLLIRLPESGMAPAAADELRLAVLRLRAAGKPVVAHSQGLYSAGAVTSTYMLGAATGEFWMQPAASLQAVGMASEDMFLKRLFDRYGVRPDFERREEYKNAVDPLLYDDYTPAYREATLAWMSSIYESNLAAAAADRNLSPADLKAALEAGPYGAEQALALKLIDRIGQVREAEAALIARAGRGARLVDFGDYQPPRRETATAGTVAVISAEGAILTGSSDNQGFGGGQAVYSDDIAEAFQDAIRDSDVKAIVFRISSPGGSDTASEQILAAVRAAKAAGKPVVVSMGTYAASGGYWVASQASEILAHPTTLTGSIGVYGGKFALGDALARWGVDLRSLTVGGPFADAFSLDEPFSPAQRQAFSAWMDRIYEGFIARVAEGRGLAPEQVREIAKGRVWTGEQARALGLVDGAGGFYEAVEAAKRLADIDADREVRLKALPEPQSTLTVLRRALGVSAEGARALAAAAWVLGDPRAETLLDQVVRARLTGQGATVLAPAPLR